MRTLSAMGAGGGEGCDFLYAVGRGWEAVGLTALLMWLGGGSTMGAVLLKQRMGRVCCMEGVAVDRMARRPMVGRRSALLIASTAVPQTRR